MKVFAEARSGRPSPFRSPAATEKVSVKGGITAELSPQAPSAKTAHMAIKIRAEERIGEFARVTLREVMSCWTLMVISRLDENPSAH
jgi:hypothetical protein